MTQQTTTRLVVMQPSLFTRFLQWLGWFGFALCVVMLIMMVSSRSEYFDTSGDLRERFHSGAESGDDKVAVIAVEGLIGDGEGFAWRQTQRVLADDSVKAVVVRVNSPGGTISGSDFIFHHLKRLRTEKKLPVVVSMGGVAASGGYYVSMAVGDEPDTIFAEPTTTTGSIGVVIPHYDVSAFMEQWGLKDDSIATHPRKLMLSMTRPVSDEDRELAQSYVEESLEKFKSVIFEGRPAFQEAGEISHEGVDLATGEIFSADNALKYGLVDKIGYLEDAIQRAMELANLRESDTRVVRFEPLTGLLDFGAGSIDARAESWQWNSPRGFYLTTTDPIAAAMVRSLIAARP